MPSEHIGFVPLPGRVPFTRNEEGNIKVVDLVYAPATDEDVAKLSTAPSIEELRLSGTKITDAGVKHLIKLPNLKTLWLSHTAITEACLEDLLRIPSLTTLELSWTSISEEAAEELKAVRPGLQVNNNPKP
jgi:hypothetical protein